MYDDISFDEYKSWDAVNRSVLGAMAKSPAHAYAMEHPAEPEADTAAKKIGRAVHSAILEPMAYLHEYLVVGDVDRRTKAGKETWKEALDLAEQKGLEILSAKEGEQVQRISDMVWTYPPAIDWIDKITGTEVSLCWRDAKTGLTCKGRLDAWNRDKNLVVDLKTTADASYNAFQASIVRYGYHQQAAFYLDGLEKLTHCRFRFVFLVVESAPPYAVAIYELNEESIELGRQELDEAMDQYEEAVEANHWPGYADCPEPRMISLPAWKWTE